MADAIDVVMNEAARRFEARLGDEIAFADYRLRDGVMILPHTVVPDAFSGRGVGSALAQAALSYAREQGLDVEPTCPFIAAYIARHPEWQDLVRGGHRETLD